MPSFLSKFFRRKANSNSPDDGTGRLVVKKSKKLSKKEKAMLRKSGENGVLKTSAVDLRENVAPASSHPENVIRKPSFENKANSSRVLAPRNENAGNNKQEKKDKYKLKSKSKKSSQAEGGEKRRKSSSIPPPPPMDEVNFDEKGFEESFANFNENNENQNDAHDSMEHGNNSNGLMLVAIPPNSISFMILSLVSSHNAKKCLINCTIATIAIV